LFLLRHLLPLSRHSRGDVLLEHVALTGEQRLAFTELILHAPELELLRFQQRRGKRFGELDFGLAMRAVDDRVGRSHVAASNRSWAQAHGVSSAAHSLGAASLLGGIRAVGSRKT